MPEFPVTAAPPRQNNYGKLMRTRVLNSSLHNHPQTYRIAPSDGLLSKPTSKKLNGDLAAHLPQSTLTSSIAESETEAQVKE